MVLMAGIKNIFILHTKTLDLNSPLSAFQLELDNVSKMMIRIIFSIYILISVFITIDNFEDLIKNEEASLLDLLK